MHRDRVGQLQLIQFTGGVGNDGVFKFYPEFSSLGVDLSNLAGISIEDFLIVVIDLLHHLVADSKLPLLEFNPFPSWIENLLQALIQMNGSC